MVTEMEECEQLRQVVKNPESIRHIKAPTRRVQMSAVVGDPYCIKYVVNPKLDVQLYAVTRHEDVISCIHCPSEEVMLAAVSVFPSSLRFLLNPTRRVQLRAVHGMPSALALIEDPDAKAIEVGVRLYPEQAFELDLDLKYKRLAVQRKPSLVKGLAQDVIIALDLSTLYNKLVTKTSGWSNPYSMV